MNLQLLINDLVRDTLEVSLPRYLPELILCASIVVMLLVRVMSRSPKVPPFLLALVGSILALGAALPTEGMSSWEQPALQACELFTGMLVYDSLYLYLRIFLLAFLLLFIVLSRLTGIADKREGQDFYTLAFGATLGMCIMASANHLMVIFLGIEMASVPSYVLAGVVQGRRRSSEASLKYAIYGAGTAGVMLYGISLLAGVLGTAHLPTMAQRLASLDWAASVQESESSTESENADGEQKSHSHRSVPEDKQFQLTALKLRATLETVVAAETQSATKTGDAHEKGPDHETGQDHDGGDGNSQDASGTSPMTLMVLALGGLMLGVGLAFKLSAVPFHFWCPDVFEGASAEVDAFLSIASKAAAITLLLRIGLGLGTLPQSVALQETFDTPPVASQQTTDQSHPVVSLISTSKVTGVDDGQAGVAQGGAAQGIVLVKESGKKDVGGKDHHLETDKGHEADSGSLSMVRSFFVLLVGLIAAVTCTFGNLAAYGQTNIKRMLAYSTIAHAGYMMMAVAAAVSLVGKDPLQMRVAAQSLLLYASIYLFMNLGAFSFVAFLRNAMGSENIKDYAGLIRSCPWMTVSMVVVLVSLVGIPPMAGFIGKFRIFQALFEAGGPLMMFLLVIAGLNTAISLVYYLRVVKTLCIDPEPDSRGPVTLGFFPVAYTLLVSFPVLLFGILPSWLVDWAYQATAQMFI